jgi:hypothetical protein
MAYEPLNTLKEENRVLEILPSGLSDLVNCKLYNIPLGDAPEFNAISYVWGDPLDTEKIVVNRQVREVTVNCWEVLNIYSGMLACGYNRPIWIDAICLYFDRY